MALFKPSSSGTCLKRRGEGETGSLMQETPDIPGASQEEVLTSALSSAEALSTVGGSHGIGARQEKVLPKLLSERTGRFDKLHP